MAGSVREIVQALLVCSLVMSCIGDCSNYIESKIVGIYCANPLIISH